MIREGDTVLIDHGRLKPSDPNYGLPVECYVCNAPHPASGATRIRHGQTEVYRPVCETCYGDANGVMRKFSDSLDLEITDGGDASAEQIAALAEKTGKPEH